MISFMVLTSNIEGCGWSLVKPCPVFEHTAAPLPPTPEWFHENGRIHSMSRWYWEYARYLRIAAKFLGRETDWSRFRFLISDGASYINGDMVVQDGGAHLRGSGAEDLLQWTEEQWEIQRAGRAKG